ncbi:LAME_0F09802g1_1 [Lachancea meyersii CBS 8951]|uniref:LAME_0F09802g1_1 n=1 Tax=Lachancea meyersii CBS 8951 TaxID=1266667 RepID=A0A1G4JV58_9SACH|nr:LAME_0F09802g1_1 [Lachancea meyersii CBS 8951]
MRAATHEEEDLESSELELSPLSSSDSFEPKAFEGKPVEMKRPAVGKEHSTTSRDLASVKSNVTLKGEGLPAQRETSSSSSLSAVDKAVTRNLNEGRSESVAALEKEGLDLHKKAIPDINNPVAISADAEFPEEYNLETDTGLVKATTLHQLNRLESRTSVRSSQSQKRSLIASMELPDATSVKSTADSGLDAEKLRKAVEKNKRQIEKYQERKKSGGLKGFLVKFFH